MRYIIEFSGTMESSTFKGENKEHANLWHFLSIILFIIFFNEEYQTINPGEMSIISDENLSQGRLTK